MEPTNNNFNNNPYPAGPEPLPPQQPIAPQQPVIPQQPMQPMAYQQPMQPMQPVPTPYDNNIAFTNAAPKKSKGFLVIIILVIVCLGAIGGGLAFAMINKQSTPTPTPAPQPDEPVGKTKFEDLTKEEALAFLMTQEDARGILPENYVEDEVYNAVSKERTNFGLILGSSHADSDELEEEAHRVYDQLAIFRKYLDGETDIDTSDDFFETEEYDYYAIIKPVKDPAECSMIENCNSYLSFKRDYIDSEPSGTDSSYYITSSDYIYYLRTDDEELANALLRTYSVAGIYRSGLMNIYDYDFEETDDEFILTVHFIMPGYNFNDLAEAAAAQSGYTSDNLAINLFNGVVSADKTTGLITSNLSDASMLDDIVNVFPLTDEDIELIPSYSLFHEMYGSSSSDEEYEDEFDLSNFNLMP